MQFQRCSPETPAAVSSIINITFKAGYSNKVFADVSVSIVKSGITIVALLGLYFSVNVAPTLISVPALTD